MHFRLFTDNLESGRSPLHHHFQNFMGTSSCCIFQGGFLPTSSYLRGASSAWELLTWRRIFFMGASWWCLWCGSSCRLFRTCSSSSFLISQERLDINVENGSSPNMSSACENIHFSPFGQPCGAPKKYTQGVYFFGIPRSSPPCRHHFMA